ncbi:MAG: hypothetical protein K8I00_02600 [Candidatus Omnitrophica bacterium]|nr:hypothetical protein [Candidatus Omnitrophota bacterium]
MMKTATLSVLTGLIMVMAVSISDAQMINYQRRNTKGEARAATKKVMTSTRAAAKKINYYGNDFKQDKTIKKSQGEPLVTNRVERLYDLNRDGLLQPDEVADFYKDVVSSVRNKGDFQVSSELLRNFDENKDGRISRYEIQDIANQIN